MRLVDIGFGNVINADKVVAVVNADTAPARRLISAAKERNLLIDWTCGKRSVCLYVMDSEHVVLSAKKPANVSAGEAV